MKDTKYTPVMGLEVHVELKTKSKMFCGCSADYFGKEPNTHTCPVCLGLPGALPVPNKTAIDWCIKIGLALGCEIQLFSKFDRKNYFYPDLPKGYQISQYDKPFALGGSVTLSDGRKIGITRVHMEEDTAKLTHQLGIQNSKFKIQNDEGYSLIDFNRSGVPLVEIVTEPDFQNAKQVVEYLKKLQQIVRYLDVSNADMEKGDMRLEPNISLRVTSDKQQVTSSADGENVSRVTSDMLPPYKVEVKNINSFRFVEKAIEFEIKRQAEILDKGETPLQETRGWDENKQKTVSQRVKEEANDYRYFPEPDIPPLRFTKSNIDDLRSNIGELPDEKMKRFVSEFNLSEYDAEILTRDRKMADYFEEAVKNAGDITPKQIANVIIHKKIDTATVSVSDLLTQIKQTTTVTTVDESKLKETIQQVLDENEQAVKDYKNGKTNVLMFLVGQIMRKFTEKIDAKIVIEMTRNMLQ